MLNKDQSNKDDTILVSHFMDLANRAGSKSIITYTQFLGLHERDLFLKHSKAYGTGFKIYGGYEDSERAVAAFLPSYSYSEEIFYPIDCIKISYSHHDADKLSHRDFLGSLLGLGIKREMLGDIKIDKKACCAYVFSLEKISGYICDNLLTVGRCSVEANVITLDECDIKPEFTLKKITVPSMRLDCILGNTFNLSRSRAAELIKAGLSYVNGMETENTSLNIKDGDIISLKKFGKFKVSDQNKMSRKNKIVLDIYIYS